jgi:hypothetical protein
LDFEFNNAEQIWWQYSSECPICFDAFVLSHYAFQTSYGIEAIKMRDVMPSLRSLLLVSSDSALQIKNVQISKNFKVSPFERHEQLPIICWSSELSVKWFLGLPATLTSFQAPYLARSASHILSTNHGLALPLPPSVTDLSTELKSSWLLPSILPFANQIVSIGLIWEQAQHLHYFPNLLHLTLHGFIWNSRDAIAQIIRSWKTLPPTLVTLELKSFHASEVGNDFLLNLPPSLQKFVIEGSGSAKCLQLPDEMPNLSVLAFSNAAYFEWPRPKFPSQLTSLDIFVKGSSFDSTDLPPSLTQFDLFLGGQWLPEHSLGLPKSLTSFSFQHPHERNDSGCHKGYFALPSHVTKLSLLSNNTLKIDDFAQFSRNLIELHLPCSTTMRDFEVALIPRHWQVISLLCLEVTGKTLTMPIEGDCLTIEKISDSIVPLLPPKMSRFWHVHSAKSTRISANQCRLSFEKNLFSLPNFGIKILDFRSVSKTSQGPLTQEIWKRAFEDAEAQKTLLEFHSVSYLPTGATARGKLPSSLTRLSSNAEGIQHAEALPFGLRELILPNKSIYNLPHLPMLEKVICKEFLVPNYGSNTRLLSHLTLCQSARATQLKASLLPRTLTYLKVETPPDACITWGDSDFPPGLTALISPMSYLDGNRIFFLPSTIKEFVVKEISLKSFHLAPCLPNHVGSNEIVIGSLASKLEEAKLNEFRNHHSDYWSTLRCLSNTTILPIVESLLMTMFSNLQRLEMICNVDWDVVHIPLLPPLLESSLLKFNNEQHVLQITGGALNPNQTPESMGTLKNASSKEMPVKRILRPYFAALPSSLKRISFSFPLPHWAPRLLPRTLEILECDGSLLNLQSYRDLPRTLTAVGLSKVPKFYPKHALSLPPCLQLLTIECVTMDDRVMAHLPRTLTALKCENCRKLSASCFADLPSSVTAIDITHLRDTATKLPSSIILSRQIINNTHCSSLLVKDPEVASKLRRALNPGSK